MIMIGGDGAGCSHADHGILGFRLKSPMFPYMGIRHVGAPRVLFYLSICDFHIVSYTLILEFKMDICKEKSGKEMEKTFLCFLNTPKTWKATLRNGLCRKYLWSKWIRQAFQANSLIQKMLSHSTIRNVLTWNSTLPAWH